MDTILAKAIVDLEVPYFGKSLKNKGDSRSCLFMPRRLLSDPRILEHCARRMSKIARDNCSSQVLMGMATSGIVYAGCMSLYCKYPMMYVRKQIESHMSNKMIAGIYPRSRKVILVDDLIFAGESKNEAMNVLKREGFKVTDVLVVIDRELERKKDGPPLERKWNVKLHSLITMSEIIDYMIKKGAITKEQLEELIKDYQRYARWRMPLFARKKE